MLSSRLFKVEKHCVAQQNVYYYLARPCTTLHDGQGAGILYKIQLLKNIFRELPPHVPGYSFMRKGASGDTPERRFFAEEVGYGHLDHFELVAWRLALDSVLRKKVSRLDCNKGPVCEIWQDL